jgi:hypothetical protein
MDFEKFAVVDDFLDHFMHVVGLVGVFRNQQVQGGLDLCVVLASEREKRKKNIAREWKGIEKRERKEGEEDEREGGW